MSAILLSPQQKSLARHALGLPNRNKRSWRNHFVAGPGSVDHDLWSQMVRMGAARQHPPTALTGGDDLFTLTQDGARAALQRGETFLGMGASNGK